MPTLIPPFTAIPTLTNTRAEFSARAFTLASELNPFVTASNAQAGENNAAALAVAANAAAANSARVAAEAAAANASATAGATRWVSGKAYTAGEVVWSPVSLLTYRRRSGGSGTTDPASDSPNWQPLIFGGVAQLHSNAATNGEVFNVQTEYSLYTVAEYSRPLPAAPSIGDKIILTNLRNTWGNGLFTLTRNDPSHRINYFAENVLFDTNDFHRVELTYVWGGEWVMACS